MAYPVPATQDKFGQTRRTDGWWIVPVVMLLSFAAFVVYSTWAALFRTIPPLWEPYHSPFYSPDLSNLIPGFKLSPALLILWVPAGFRLTCYYARKAYHRSIGFNPQACTVGKGANAGYRGEVGWPWVFNNLHRYFLYLIIILVIFHWIHFVEAFSLKTVAGEGYRFGLGSLIIISDTMFLTLYVASCHSLRHLIGGNVDCFSCACGGKSRHHAWKGVSWLNEYHNNFFWLSLFTVAFADFYAWICAMGFWSDVRFF